MTNRWITVFGVAVLLGGVWLPAQAARILEDPLLGDPEAGELEAGGAEEEEDSVAKQRFLMRLSGMEWEVDRGRVSDLDRALEAGRYEEALTLVREIPGGQMSPLDRAYYEASLLMELDRAAEAVAVLEPLSLRGEKGATQCRLLLGLARMQAGQWAQAEKGLVALNAQRLPLNELLIRVVSQAESAPEPLGLTRMLSQAAWQEADALALVRAAVLLFGRGQFPPAETMARRAILADPEQAGGHFILGSSLLSLQRPQEAEHALGEAIRIQPEYPEALGNLAILHYQRGETSTAMLLLIQALELKIDYADGWENYLKLLSRELVPREGLAALPAPPAGEGQTPAVWHWQAAMKAMGAGDAQLATRHFLRSLSLDLNDPNAHNDFAVLLMQVDRKPLALPFLRAAAALAPDSELVRENLDRVSGEVRQQILEQEVAALEKKLAAEENPADRLALAQTLSSLERYGEAIDAFRPVLKADSENPRWQFRMAWLLLQQPDPDWRDLELAENLARQACEVTEYRRRDCVELLARALAANGEPEEAQAMRKKAAALEKTAP